MAPMIVAERITSRIFILLVRTVGLRMVAFSRFQINLYLCEKIFPEKERRNFVTLSEREKEREREREREKD